MQCVASHDRSRRGSVRRPRARQLGARTAFRWAGATAGGGARKMRKARAPRRSEQFLGSRPSITQPWYHAKGSNGRKGRVPCCLMADSYDFRSFERSWQERWERDGIYRADDASAKPKYYVLDMLPYPSGDLHVGHAKNYTLGDAVARMQRMLGIRRAAPDGLGRIRPAGRKRGDRPRDRSGRWTTREHRKHAPPDPADGDELRLDREIATCDPSTTAGTSGSSIGSTTRAWPTSARRR